MSQGTMVSKIDVQRELGVMVLTWEDATRQEVGLDELRRLCPCALCEGNRMAQEADGLHIITSDELHATADVSEVIPVGRYAIQIRWHDGHDTGIYTYTYLKSLGTVTPS